VPPLALVRAICLIALLLAALCFVALLRDHYCLQRFALLRVVHVVALLGYIFVCLP
jgi:hypothetical protein